MPLQLEIVSEHREIVGDDAVRDFYDDGGTIGRSLHNDWILPDPDKYISSKHAAIDVRGGIYYLVDLSSNGVYFNDEHEPIGRGNTQRLFDGDRLRMGDFEIVVRISEGESIEMPLEEEQTSLPEPIEQSVDEVRLESGIKLLDEDELADDDLNDLLFGDDAGAETSVESLDFFDELETEAAAEQPLPEPEPPTLTSDDQLLAFLDGAGIDVDELGHSFDAEEVLRNAGGVFREFVDGITRLLASRANLKTTFRLDQTIMLPSQNNPIKLSERTADSIRQLLLGHDDEYIAPRNAAREVCRDLLFHQDAFLDAMTAAFNEFADRFDPDELLGTFGESSTRKSLLGFLGSSKNWDLYCDIYPALTEKAGGRFPQMFAEEFVRSYEHQIAEYKHAFPADVDYPPKAPDFGSTQVHEKTIAIKAPRGLDKQVGEPRNDDVAKARNDDEIGEAQNDPDASDRAEQN